jgi:hypothetical protein
MSTLDMANLQALAKFHNLHGEWMVMHWNALAAFPSHKIVLNVEKPEQQLMLPGFFSQDDLPSRP